MSNPALDAILPWDKVKDPAISAAIRALRREPFNIVAMIMLASYIRDPTSPEWKRLEDRIRESLPRPLLQGCGTEAEVIENIHRCLRNALSSGEYSYAMWVLYLAEREHIPLVDQRYWRQLDQIISRIPLNKTISGDDANFAATLLAANNQRQLVGEYLHRLIREERWELVIRFFKLPFLNYHIDSLRVLPTWLIMEMLEYSPWQYVADYIQSTVLPERL